MCPLSRKVQIIALLAPAAPLIAGVTVAPQTPSLAIVGVDVIYVGDGQVLTNRTVTISGDTTSSVAENAAPPPSATVTPSSFRACGTCTPI
jgi:hypothetical protein